MRTVLLLFLLLLPFVSEAQTPNIRAEKIADGFIDPWALGFLPDGGLLVTERGGALWHVTASGKRKQIAGLPEIQVKGQGGLLDVMIPRDFATSREIFLSYAKPQRGGSSTALFRAKWPAGSPTLQGETVFEMQPGSSGGRHFGSRIVEAPDGRLYLTIGERGDRPSAQDLSRENGSIIRLNRDGSVPADNPFVDHPDAQPEIWSYGHRNPQGAALDAAGALWAVEHGARGGDEVNAIRKGLNYGWPVIAYGRHYSGFRIGEGSHKDGMEQPAYYWDPSIAPSGMAFHSGKTFPDWSGAIFIGSLKFDYISVLKGAPLKEISKIELPETARVRDVREGPDGTIWFISETDGAVYRLAK